MLPISEESIAGYVALTGEIVVVDDAYAVPEGYRFRVNREFDIQAGYRTKSMRGNIPDWGGGDFRDIMVRYISSRIGGKTLS